MNDWVFANIMRAISVELRMDVCDAVAMILDEYEPAESLLAQVDINKLWRPSAPVEKEKGDDTD